MKKEHIDTNSLAHTKWNCKYHMVIINVEIKIEYSIFFAYEHIYFCNWEKSIINILSDQTSIFLLKVSVRSPVSISKHLENDYIQHKNTRYQLLQVVQFLNSTPGYYVLFRLMR